MDKKPLYIVRISDKGYYSSNKPYEATTKENADKLTHKEALLVCNKLKQPRLGYHASIESA